MYVCMYAFKNVCMYAFIYVYIHTELFCAPSQAINSASLASGRRAYRRAPMRCARRSRNQCSLSHSLPSSLLPPYRRTSGAHEIQTPCGCPVRSTF